jgi:acyl-CoA thioesterase I
VVGCGEPEANDPPGPEERAEERAGERIEPRSEPMGRILVVGTSLTAGPGITAEAAYPARLQERIDDAGLPYRVINAGVSGETSAGALRRLDWLLREPADIVIVETGANDMLRGLDPDSTRANLDAILRRLRAADPAPRVLLVPMRALPNLGRDYARRFEAIYPEVAARHDVTLLPFLLDDVAGNRTLNLPDGIHPNARGHERMADNLWPGLRDALR